MLNSLDKPSNNLMLMVMEKSPRRKFLREWQNLRETSSKKTLKFYSTLQTGMEMVKLTSQNSP